MRNLDPRQSLSRVLRPAILLAAVFAAASPVSTFPDAVISKEASDRCGVKVAGLEAFAAASEPKRGQTTRFSEDEINSYLALELSQKYHPSLKSLLITLEDSKVRGVATVDFDALGMHSKSVVAKMFARLFAGVHELSVKGKLMSAGGKGHFLLEEARFDQSTLPNFLVEEIITAVGRKQKPPFDPVQPSQLPYQIDRVEVHPGFIIVVQ